MAKLLPHNWIPEVDDDGGVTGMVCWYCKMEWPPSKPRPTAKCSLEAQREAILPAVTDSARRRKRVDQEYRDNVRRAKEFKFSYREIAEAAELTSHAEIQRIVASKT